MRLHSGEVVGAYKEINGQNETHLRWSVYLPRFWGVRRVESLTSLTVQAIVQVRMQNGLFGRKTTSELLVVFLPKDYPSQCYKILFYLVDLVSKYAFVAECPLILFTFRNPKNSLEYSKKAEFMSHLGNW